MSTEHHVWELGRPPPEIRAHSLAKHRVLSAYLKKYVSVLTSDVRQDEFRLTLIDGFSGGGRYLDQRTKEDRPGSPLIMLDAMSDAQAAAQSIRTKPFRLEACFLFVEKKPEYLQYLRHVIETSKYRDYVANGKIEFIEGEFVERLPEILGFVKRRSSDPRAIFLLDQFGYSAVPMPSIKKILHGTKKAEVILTFATDFLVDYLSESQAMQEILEKVGINIPAAKIKSAKDERDWKRVIQFTLHREIPERTGAGYYTPFFIRSVDSGRDLWLIHLSGHHRARDVMVDLHWQESNSFVHYGKPGLGMLGYDQGRDGDWTKQLSLPGFHFDETAKEMSREKLLEQLPTEIFSQKSAIGFEDFFAQHTNDCPVTSEIMREVLNQLAKEGVIRVRDITGSKTRRGGIVKATDLIMPHPQSRIIFD